MSDLTKGKTSRRGMIKGAAAVAAGATLAACQPKVVEVTRVVEQEKIVEKEVEKEVTRVVEQQAAAAGVKVVPYITQLWNWQKLNMATATDEYNRLMRDKVRMEVDPSPEGWETKVVQMVRDGELQWDGMLRQRNVGDVLKLIRMDIVQPWDPFIEGSSAPWADKYFDELLPNVREAFTFEGKFYGLPWDGEVFCRVYRKDQWDKLGEAPAETLEEFEMQLQEMKKIFPDKIPFGLRNRPQMPDHHMLMQLWADDPWVHEDFGSIIDFRSDAYQQQMSMLKRWYDTGLIADDTWDDATTIETWNKGICTCVQTGAAWAQAQAQKVWGAANIVPMANFVINKGDTPKTLAFNNAAVLFKGAQYPQEVADWLLWMLDPTVEKIANHSFHKGYLYYYHLPVYKSVFENIVPSNPDWAWMGEGIYEMVKASAPIPSDARHNEVGSISLPWEQKYVHGSISLKECVDGADEEVRALISDMDSGKK